MRTFLHRLAKFFVIGLVPFLVLMAGYFYYDPFMVIRKYDDFSHSAVLTNRDYISTESFVNKHERNQYNSFIFGSSRTLAFSPSHWAKYLGEEARPYSFDGSNESIYGIAMKMKYLDQQQVAIKNALIILCRDASFARTSAADHKGHLFVKDPRISGESSLMFHKEFVKSYLSPLFLYSLYNYTYTGSYKDYMEGFINTKEISFDPVTNEQVLTGLESELAESPERYYEKRRSVFYKRYGERTDSVNRIKAAQLALLKDIRQILKKHHTNYKVVVSPLYEQVRLSPADESVLKELFGDQFYDFSGKNYFTDSVSHYYEKSHYRPFIGDSLMAIIYR